MAARDHYDVLGVRRDAPPEEIKSAFKRLASLNHPDRNQDDPAAHERFKEVALAYQVLSDPNRRGMYDRFGHRAEAPGSPFGSSGPFPGGFVDISDIAIDGILGDLLGVFGVGRGDKGDIKRELELTFEEAAFGCEKSLRYDRVVSCADCTGTGAATGTTPESCSACNGRGRVRFQQGIFPIAVERTCSRCRGTGRTVKTPCAGCRGSGLMSASESVKVTIPAGVDAGATKLVTGAGNKPRTDKAAGDLEITLQVRAHTFFRRDADDVLCTVPVTFTHAALGGEVEVPTLDGKVTLKVPAGTSSGTVLRVRNRGVAAGSGRNAKKAGDLLVKVEVVVPTELTDEQKTALESLAAVTDPAPRIAVDG